MLFYSGLVYRSTAIREEYAAVLHYLVNETLTIRVMKPVFFSIFIITVLSLMMIVCDGRAEYTDIEKSRDFYNIGTAMAEQGDYTGAIAAFKKSILYNRHNAKAHAGLGWAYFSVTDFDKAELHWHEAIELNPQSSAALFGTGYLYFMHEDFDAASRTFKAIITQYPKSASVHAALGRVYVKQGKIDDAINELQKSIGLNPEERLSYWTLSEIYESRGKFKMAEEYRNKAMEGE